MDEGREFAGEVSKTLQNECCVKRKIISSRNPQSNSMIERCHKTLHNMIRRAQIKDKRDLDSLLGFKGVLAACLKAMNSTVHITACATPAQSVFSRDAMSNATFQADWQFIQERKQKLIIQNNKHENAERKPHAHHAGNVVAVMLEDVCICNNGILEVFTSRSTTSSGNSSNNNAATISNKLICLPTNRSLHPTFVRNCPQRPTG